MANQLISYADLSTINRSIRSINSNLAEVKADIGLLDTKQRHIETELIKLADTFAGFMAADLKHKSLQLAETRQGNLKQDLQIRFGYYAEVRRIATGIIQGVDVGVVGEATLTFATEEVMIKAPGYWLAPALVALASWIGNDRTVSQRAVLEALKRDDYKATLFFMLVMRRLARNDSSFKWLERFFMHQDPHRIDREFIVILEAVATGIFSPAAKNLMMGHVKQWIDQLTTGETFVNEQKVQWISFFEAIGTFDGNSYPLLGKYAVNWDLFETSLKEARAHLMILAHFNGIIAASSDFSKGIKVQLDEVLSLLVTNFDDEELPLQQEVRLNQLIIEARGDEDAARARMDVEKQIFETQVDFLQLLTNASFNPDLSGATKVTQVLAVSIGQPWILEAYDTFTAQCRSRVPHSVDLDIDGFKTSTKDGKDENELVAGQEAFYQEMLAQQLLKLAFPYGGVIIGVLVCLGGLWLCSLYPIAGIIGVAIGLILTSGSVSGHKKARKKVKDEMEERSREAREVLRGCIAEIVDYRKEHDFEDAHAEQVRQLLVSITPEDFSSISKETARNLV